MSPVSIFEISLLILKSPMSPVDFKKWQCPLLNLRKCHLLNVPVDFKVVQCRLSNLRRCHVAMSKFKGQGPPYCHHVYKTAFSQVEMQLTKIVRKGLSVHAMLMLKCKNMFMILVKFIHTDSIFKTKEIGV